MREVVAFTTIRQGTILNEIERVRSEIFFETSKALYDLGIPCVAISSSTKLTAGIVNEGSADSLNCTTATLLPDPELLGRSKIGGKISGNNLQEAG